MDFWQSIALGGIQGLTEFLPISSTAHLRVFPALVGWEDPGAAWTAVVQMGTLLAVVVYFFKDMVSLLAAWGTGLWQRRPFAEAKARLAWILLLGSIPIGVAGLLFRHAIETSLRSLWVVASALAGLALLLALAEWLGAKRKDLSHMGWFDGLLVGIAQAVALIPGSSRSGVTLTAGMFVGLNRAEAARFCFLLSIPAVAASGLFELVTIIKKGGMSGAPWVSLLAGTATAFVVGYLAIAFLMRFLRHRSTWIFIGYRLILAGCIFYLLTAGFLAA